MVNVRVVVFIGVLLLLLMTFFGAKDVFISVEPVSKTKHTLQTKQHSRTLPSHITVEINLTKSLERQSSVLRQLQLVEASLPLEVVRNFDFQKTLKREHNDTQRGFRMSFTDSIRRLQIPVPKSCPSSIRPDVFCAPNIGRDWKPGHRVFPLSYSLPEDMYASEIPRKDKDCAAIVPRDRGTYKFTSEAEYINEYARSFYCITYKKGGWDVLRHYEIIAAGCMPYFLDIEYAPQYVLYHMPKKLLYDARHLPGVHFNCTTIQVHIDHSVFPREKYFLMLQELLWHAKKYLTTKAMAKYVLEASGSGDAKSVLFLARPNKNTPLRAQGQYNSWTLMHGLRLLLGANAVDSHEISFLYEQPEAVAQSVRKKLYGLGFGYGFKLPRIEVNRSNLADRIIKKEFDVVIYGDPSSMVHQKHFRTIDYLDLLQKHYSREKILFLHVPDIPYAESKFFGYSIETLYSAGTVFQREIADCKYFVPVDREGEAMKRCVWYHNKNCFDDVNVAQTLKEKRLGSYVWEFAEQ